MESCAAGAIPDNTPGATPKIDLPLEREAPLSDTNDPEMRAPLGLMRLMNPNEALDLAIRLLAGEVPFRDIRLGMSTGVPV